MADEIDITDESLMERICNGDHQAFEMLVNRYHQILYAAAFRTCNDVDLSEDVVQEALLKLWKKPQSFDSRKGVKLSTWMYRVVVNLTLDKLRAKKRRGVWSDDTIDSISDDRMSAIEQMVMNERQELLEKAIMKLPERQRVALNLCFFEGLSNKEAAYILGVGVKAVESLLMRAKASLKNNLSPWKG